MVLYVGDDWAEDHHDVHLMDESGERLAARRLPEGVAGVTALHALVAQHAAGPGDVVIGIETDRGPWVSALVAAGYHVYAINPRSAARYRERHHVGGAKSDAGDAKLLADLVRTDRHNHREVAGDSDGGRSAHSRPRPPAARLGPDPADSQPAAQRAQGVLPGRPGGLPRPRARRRGGRAGDGAWPARGGPAEHLGADPLRAQARRPPAQASSGAPPRSAPRSLPQLEAPVAVSKAFAASTRAAMRVIGEINRQIKELEAELSDRILSSTRTPASTVPCPVSVWSSAPGCSASSGMTPNATTRRSPAGTTPVPRR